MTYPLNQLKPQKGDLIFLNPFLQNKNYRDLEKRFSEILHSYELGELKDSLAIRKLISLLEDLKEFEDPYTVPVCLIKKSISFEQLLTDTIYLLSSTKD